MKRHSHYNWKLLGPHWLVIMDGVFDKNDLSDSPSFGALLLTVCLTTK